MPALVLPPAMWRDTTDTVVHHGVLFLDELPEFSRHVLEVLREPLESGRITISRAAHQADFPAAFQFVAAMNPCPCGYLGHFTGKCRCNTEVVARYRGRISGPLLDRIDLHVAVPALAPEELEGPCAAESSATVRKRVTRARARQLARQGVANAQLSSRDLDERARADDPARKLLREAARVLNLSARARQRVMRVSRTIADLDSSECVHEVHAAEALSYR